MGKKKKKGKARRQHTGPGEEEREPRAFVEWKRDVTRKIAEQQARVTPATEQPARAKACKAWGISSEEVAQQMSVICFLRDFTTWDAVDIENLVRHEGLHTMDDIPRLFDFHVTREWDIPWTHEAAALFDLEWEIPWTESTEKEDTTEKQIEKSHHVVHPEDSTVKQIEKSEEKTEFLTEDEWSAEWSAVETFLLGCQGITAGDIATIMLAFGVQTWTKLMSLTKDDVWYLEPIQVRSLMTNIEKEKRASRKSRREKPETHGLLG